MHAPRTTSRVAMGEDLGAATHPLFVPGQRLGARTLRVDPVEIDFDARRVRVHGRPVHVPEREMLVLALLMQHAGRVVSRRELLHDVWRTSSPDVHKSIEVHINRLRRRLQGAGAEVIRTVRGHGYVMDLPGDRPVT